MHALAFLAVATTIVVGGGEDAAATVADGGACGNGRVIPDDRELELFHTVTDHGAWRGATFESTDEVLRFRGEVVMAADETVYVEALARYVVLEPNRGVFDAALGLALETAASASPFLGFWEENAPLLRSGQFDGVLYDAFRTSPTPPSSRRRGGSSGPAARWRSSSRAAASAAPPTPRRRRECGDWGLARSRLDAGWLPGELKEPVPMRVSLGFEHSGARRTRTMLVTEAVRAPAGGAAAVPVPDRAALDRDLRAAAPELATRGEWQALPAAPRRRR
ncbi:protein-arginine N5-methyltransferase [Aureococcus anophagefferens]|nr:protein-arginine N5-methyltransferase [Aureococcus anophagefferens]